MSERPLVSVVMPAYNAAGFIADALNSALAQTYRPIEVLVADDGSSDGTAAVVKGFGAPVVYLHQQNRGPAGARNLALSHARGDFVAFLDADDLWHPRKLDLQVAAMQSDPELGMLGTQVTAKAPAGPAPDHPALTRVSYRRLYLGNLLTTSSVLVRRDLLNGAETFDEQFFGPEDFDVWLRVAARSAVAVLGAPLTCHREVEGSVQGNPERMRRCVRGVLDKADRAGGRPSLLAGLQARANLEYRTAWQHSMQGRQWTALARVLQSFAFYPLWMPSGVLRMPCARVRLLARVLMRAVAKPAAAGTKNGA